MLHREVPEPLAPENLTIITLRDTPVHCALRSRALLECPEFECLSDVRESVTLRDLVDDIPFGE